MYACLVLMAVPQPSLALMRHGTLEPWCQKSERFGTRGEFVHSFYALCSKPLQYVTVRLLANSFLIVLSFFFLMIIVFFIVIRFIVFGFAVLMMSVLLFSVVVLLYIVLLL